jgi:hypothetical protein
MNGGDGPPVVEGADECDKEWFFRLGVRQEPTTPHKKKNLACYEILGFELGEIL